MSPAPPLLHSSFNLGQTKYSMRWMFVDIYCSVPLCICCSNAFPVLFFLFVVVVVVEYQVPSIPKLQELIEAAWKDG